MNLRAFSNSDPAAAPSLLALAGSLKLTLALLPLLAVGAVMAYSGAGSAWWLVAPLAAGAVNLVAAIATNRVFRSQFPLLLFHLALLALVLLLAAGRLTYLKGTAEVGEGGAFDAALADIDAGPWHPNRLDRVHFVNDGFSVDYAPGVKRGDTRNRVRYRDENGMPGQAVIGDNLPLTLYGYRFYTSFNKGFAPVFRWNPPHGGETMTGSVHLPAYPLHEYGQAREWTPPGTATPVWIMLELPAPLIDPAKADRFKLPERHTLVVRVGERRWELEPGGSAEIAGGRLHYDHLGTWMGYNIFYDWSLPWLLAACFAAVGALGFHFWRKFAARPWNSDNDE